MVREDGWGVRKEVGKVGLAHISPTAEAFQQQGEKSPSKRVSLCFPSAMSAWSRDVFGSAERTYKVIQPCFSLIRGISNIGRGCQGVMSVFPFLRIVCICALIVIHPHIPLQD